MSSIFVYLLDNHSFITTATGCICYLRCVEHVFRLICSNISKVIINPYVFSTMVELSLLNAVHGYSNLSRVSSNRLTSISVVIKRP